VISASIDPGLVSIQSLLQSGVELHAQGQLGRAEELYREITRRDPRNVQAWRLLGVIALQTGQPARAAEALQKALALDPAFAQAHNDLGTALYMLGRLDDALACHDRALALDPGDPGAACNRGNVLSALGRHEEAVASFDRAISAKPDYPEAFCNRGHALRALGRPVEALASYDRAIALKGDYAKALHARGLALREQNRLDEALASCDRALRLWPDYVEALLDRGNVLSDLRRSDEALATYEKAGLLRPDDPRPRYNASLRLLALGRLDAGLPGYEQRRGEDGRAPHRPYDQPLWTGDQPLGGKTLLIYAEQGLGDTLQFCRYARLAEDAGADVVLAVQPELTALVRSLSPTIRCVDLDDAASGPFDFHTPMLSLPLAFGTSLSSIPSWPRYLSSDEARRRAWADRMGASDRPRVGLAWSGNPNHANDSNRSMRFEQIEPILAEDAAWISLQKQVRPADAARLQQTGSIQRIGEELTDFADAAALMESLDLVITVDTSVAHVAGALGKPVWILLPFNADWRWLTDRTDSPWYPTARLFRQDAPGDWRGALRDLRRALKTWLHEERRGMSDCA
jgi:tetratricopeptide (TPR) repeat protein